MASTTTNLGLTKPAYTDSADVAVINSNMDILDTKIGAIGNTSVASQIGTLSEQIATYQISSQSSYADLQSALKTFAATIADYQTHPISVVAGFGDAIFTNNRTYIGQLYKRNATNISVLLTSHLGDTIRGSCASDTWEWKQLVTADQLGGTKFLTFNANNSSVTIDLSNGFRGILFSSSAYSSEEGIYSVRTSTAGGVSTGAFFASSGLTFNTGVNNKLTISSTRYVEFTLIIMNGTASKGN